MKTPSNYRILIIDDNRSIHEDFRKILCPEQAKIDEAEAEFFGEEAPAKDLPAFELDSAFQGASGVQLLKHSVEDGRPYAMAFVDVRMPPGIDGIETAELLWKICPDLQVVICTAHSDYSWQEMIGRLGNRDRLLVLKKPFAAVEALQLACALCEKWGLTQQARNRLAETERIVEQRTHELREANERLRTEMEQRKQAEAQLLRAQRLESIGTLASGIAHDINNMLAPIVMSAGLLRGNLPNDSLDLLTMIESSADRAARVVKQVLTFARGIEGERLPLRPKQLVWEIEKFVTETFPRQIDFATRVPGDLPLITGDATQLHQVLLNLCVNSRDAMPNGGTLRIEVNTFAVDEFFANMMPDARVGPYVRFQVSDTGTGIPQSLLEKIFDPFFTTKPVGKGTGLGLSTVVGIVRSHEGFIDVRSEPGRGSTFEIFVPAVADHAEPIVHEEERTHRTGNGELILVVDDESAIRQVTQSLLTENGYRTIVAADGAEALSIFVTQIDRIDAVFTDVMMPRMDGLALCRELRRLAPEVRIVAATGSGDEAQLEALRLLHVGKVLGKPFSSGSLLTAISQAIERRSAEFAS